MAPLVRELSIAYGLEFFSIGGGMGVVYDSALASGSAEWWREHKRPPLTPESYAAAVVPTLKSLGVKIAIEPGRFLTANAGILVAEVLYVKKTGRKNFVVVDAAMNDLIRPAFYDAYHEIVPVQSTAGKLVKTDLVGPICESGDVFCKDRPLPPLRQGDFVALMSAGAYGFSMACNYNGRPRPPEILVHRKRAHIARKRENWKDLIQGEKLLRLPLA
jgi:diaminopimelate decarboxylase